MKSFSPHGRLLSLDVFRGITVAAMVLVNNPGDWGHIYAPLKHATWNGCTPTDLIFPFFLFIVGVSIVMAFYTPKYTVSHSILLVKISKRGAILIALGLFLNLFPLFDFGHVRIFGVLQRIGIVYIVCAVLFLKTNRHTQFYLFWLILLVYYCLMRYVPVPGYGQANFAIETNLAAWLDRLLITQNHTWKQTVTWDPEGILSTLPAIASGIFGIIIGYIFKETPKYNGITALRMIYHGLTAVVLGICFNYFFPINKSLWTSSYVLFTGGLATLLFSLIYFYVDVKNHRKRLGIFLVYGKNAITVFFGSAIIAKLFAIKWIVANGTLIGIKEWLYQIFFVSFISNAYMASLLGAVTFVIIWYGIVWLMNKKNILLTV
jgi:predicted acyltransferase